MYYKSFLTGCCLLALTLGGCTATRPVQLSGNPIFDGWYADPDSAVFDGTFWVYPTYSAPYDEQLHFDAFSSPDLITWTKHERILDSSRVQWANRAMWAPCIVKNRNSYFLFFAANDIQSNDEPGGIGIAIASNPEGPFKDYEAIFLASNSNERVLVLLQILGKDSRVAIDPAHLAGSR